MCYHLITALQVHQVTWVPLVHLVPTEKMGHRDQKDLVVAMVLTELQAGQASVDRLGHVGLTDHLVQMVSPATTDQWVLVDLMGPWVPPVNADRLVPMEHPVRMVPRARRVRPVLSVFEDHLEALAKTALRVPLVTPGLMVPRDLPVHLVL